MGTDVSRGHIFSSAPNSSGVLSMPRQSQVPRNLFKPSHDKDNSSLDTIIYFNIKLVTEFQEYGTAKGSRHVSKGDLPTNG